MPAEGGRTSLRQLRVGRTSPSPLLPLLHRAPLARVGPAEDGIHRLGRATAAGHAVAASSRRATKDGAAPAGGAAFRPPASSL